MTDAYRVCPHCGDEQVMPAAWRGAPIGDVMTRMHEAICVDYLQAAAANLIVEIEAHLSRRCDFVRHGTSGAVYRCRRYACDGFHDVEREMPA